MSARASRPASNPSRSHEERRRVLETASEAAGYRLDFRLPNLYRPDVLRLHVDRTGLFLGEAKHSEGPSDSCSVDRLRVYLDCLLPLFRRGVGGLLAIAHPCCQGRAWRNRLVWVCQDVPVVGAVGSKDVTPTTTVTFVALGTGG